MSLKIVRNDITKMNTEAIVNTANEQPCVGSGCDTAVYKAAGYDTLLKYRKEKIGVVQEGEAFITPGFELKAKYIIHTVSPKYIDGEHGEEMKLRSCYRRSLALAVGYGIKSIAFPLISTGSFGYPKEEGMRIAVDEINAFLLTCEMDVYLVVFDEKATSLGERLYPGLDRYIDRNYVEAVRRNEYNAESYREMARPMAAQAPTAPQAPAAPQASASATNGVPRTAQPSAYYSASKKSKKKAATLSLDSLFGKSNKAVSKKKTSGKEEGLFKAAEIDLEEDDKADACICEDVCEAAETGYEFDEKHESKLEERMKHMTDTYSEYLMYLIKDKQLENADVYKRAIVDKKIFSKIKTNPNYHPQKLTALCLCIGAKLNLDESKDLLARAGYALSPCDKTDIIFSYFIENEIYDMIELDIQLEEHGLPCIIT